MPRQTPFAKLNIFDSVTDNGEKFITFRDLLCGTQDNSNMIKIDDILSEFNDKILLGVEVVEY